MATDIFDNAYLSIASNNVSTSVQSLELTYEVETQDDTTMGDTTRSSKGSLKNWSINATLVQDFASSALDSILSPLLGTVVAIEVRPDAGSVSTSNPKWTANALFSSYKIMGGSVGDLITTQITLIPSKGSGTATLTRATS